MRQIFLSTALASIAFFPTSASAEGAIVTAADPQSFVTFFGDNGYPAKLTEDSMGDPLIEFRINGERYDLFFYDCDNNTDCQAVQFYSGYRVEGSVDLETINSWNEDRRFARAYLTDDGAAARIEMDVATSAHGLHGEDFLELVQLWEESVELFEERIDW